jgi:hypothetical protein
MRSPSALKQSLIAAEKLSEANLTASVGLPFTLELDRGVNQTRGGGGGLLCDLRDGEE